MAGQQANYFPEHKDWPNQGGKERLPGLSEKIAKFGCSAEIEMADFVERSAEVVNDYYAEGAKAGWMHKYHLYYMSVGPKLIEKLSNNIYVVSVEPDFYQKKMAVSNDLLRESQWYLDGTGYFTGNSLGINHSKLVQKTASKIPIVAVVDTGIDYTHEDLKDRMWQNPYAALPGTYGYDFGNGDTDPMDEDSDSHGTHCAGIIGAVNNNQMGIAGICNSVKLMALKGI